MYYKGKNKEVEMEPPFKVVCANCGSHDVDIKAFDRWDLVIKCNECGSYLSCGKYNETEYEN